MTSLPLILLKLINLLKMWLLMQMLGNADGSISSILSMGLPVWGCIHEIVSKKRALYCWQHRQCVFCDWYYYHILSRLLWFQNSATCFWLQKDCYKVSLSFFLFFYVLLREQNKLVIYKQKWKEVKQIHSSSPITLCHVFNNDEKSLIHLQIHICFILISIVNSDSNPSSV